MAGALWAFTLQPWVSAGLPRTRTASLGYALLRSATLCYALLPSAGGSGPFASTALSRLVCAWAISGLRGRSGCVLQGTQGISVLGPASGLASRCFICRCASCRRRAIAPAWLHLSARGPGASCRTRANTRSHRLEHCSSGDAEIRRHRSVVSFRLAIRSTSIDSWFP